MLKSHLATLLLAAAVVLSSAGAFAQNPYTKAAAPVPASVAHQQAQLEKLPDACGPVAARAADNISLRIQGPDAMNTRTNVNVMLQAALNAAAAGDDEGCWHWYDRSQQVVR